LVCCLAIISHGGLGVGTTEIPPAIDDHEVSDGENPALQAFIAGIRADLKTKDIVKNVLKG
jgi:hypothetical protein